MREGGREERRERESERERNRKGWWIYVIVGGT